VGHPHLIRAAGAGDFAAVRSLDVEGWDPAVTPSAREQMTGLGRAAFDATAHLVAELDGAVVGYARLGHPTPLPASAHVLELQGLAVASGVRGRGIGSALLAAAIAAARERGAERLTLRVLGTNPRAQALYERNGFVVEGVLRGEFRIAGRRVDDVLMALSLG
jgi:ribosomal protein S18 acetylase RimI-like enzyme